MKNYRVVVGDRVFSEVPDLAIAQMKLCDLSKTYRGQVCRVAHMNWNTVRGTRQYINGLEVGQYELVKKILLAVHEQGGTDAATDYDRGWDLATTAALEAITIETGVSIEEVLESEEVA